MWKRGTHHLNASIGNIDLHSHTNTPLNGVKFHCDWTSINLGECEITNNFWLPDGSPVQVRIDPVENLPTLVVISIPASTAEFSNLFVTLTIASRNLATPILDMTKNQRSVDLPAYMKANLGTYTGVSLSNETCNRYDLALRH